MYMPSFGASKLPEKFPFASTPILMSGRVATPEASINSILSKGEPPAKLPETSTYLEQDIATKANNNIKKNLFILYDFTFYDFKKKFKQIAFKFRQK